MNALLDVLAKGIEGGPAAALAVSAAWGVLSIVLSPCHLASIPLIVGFMSEETDRSPRRAYAISTSFAFGILLSIAVIGVLTAGAGTLIGDVGGWANYFAAAIFLIIGLHMLGVIHLPTPRAAVVRPNGRGAWAAFLLGSIFGVALGPCTFAFMAPVLAAALKYAEAAPLLAVSLLAAYGLGHCAVIVVAGGSVSLTQRAVDWNRDSKSSTTLLRICGGLVLLGGMHLLWTAR